MDIYSSLKNNNLKLKMIFYEYTIDEDIIIHKYIVSENNYKYTKSKKNLKDNNIKKIIKNNLTEDKINCKIIDIKKNLNYKYKIPNFNLIKVNNIYIGSFMIPFDLNKDIDSKFSIKINIDYKNYLIYVTKNQKEDIIGNSLKYSNLLFNHYQTLKYYIKELYDEVLKTNNSKKNILNNELYSKYREKYIIIKERLNGIKRTIYNLLLDQYFDPEFLNELNNFVNIFMKEINNNIFDCGMKLLEINDFPLKDNFKSMLEKYNGKFKNKRHEDIIFNIIKRNLSYIYDMGNKLQNVMLEEDMKNFIKSHSNYENYDINKKLFKKSIEIYFSIPVYP